MTVGIVQRRAFRAVFRHVETFEEMRPAGDDLADMGAECLERRDARRG